MCNGVRKYSFEKATRSEKEITIATVYTAPQIFELSLRISVCPNSLFQIEGASILKDHYTPILISVTSLTLSFFFVSGEVNLVVPRFVKSKM